MKKNILLLLFIVVIKMNAQVADLQKFSKGKFYDSEVIKDFNHNIKGYFLLFETDKVSKETVELEYLILDENLNKVTNGFITEMIYEGVLFNAKRIKTTITIFNNKLLIRFNDVIGGIETYNRYRIFDLSNSKMGDMFIINDKKIEYNPKGFDRSTKNLSLDHLNILAYYKDVGFISSFESNGNKYSENQDVILYDNNFNMVWENNYQKKEKGNYENKNITYLNSSSDHLVYYNQYKYGPFEYIPKTSVIIFDVKTGKINAEYFFLDEKKYYYKVIDSYIENNQITLYGNYSLKNKNGHFDDEKSVGIFKVILDLNTGKVIEEKYTNWIELSNLLEINKNGNVKNEGNIFIHNVLQLEDKSILLVCETFLNDPIITNNIYIVEVTPNFKFKQVFVEDKFKNKYPRTNAYSSNIKKYGYFDFLDYQNLGNNEYLFYFNDNDKNSINRNKSTLFGVIHYDNGKFSKQTINLKTEVSRVYAQPAKKGYISLFEVFDDEKKIPELRLEKVNY